VDPALAQHPALAPPRPGRPRPVRGPAARRPRRGLRRRLRRGERLPPRAPNPVPLPQPLRPQPPRRGHPVRTGQPHYASSPRTATARVGSPDMPVRIVTDSSADRSADEARELGVEIVPLSIRFGSEEFKDGVDLSTSEFYERLTSSAELPETS